LQPETRIPAGWKPALRAAIDILDGLLNPLDAVLWVGVRAKELGGTVACLRSRQDLHDADQLIWIVARIVEKAHTEVIRFELIVTPELQVDQLTDQHGNLGAAGAAGIVGIIRGDHRRAGQSLGELCLGDMFCRMPRYHMADLMPQHPGKLAFGLQLVIQSARDKDLSARQGKGVDRLVVV
jgi:hypothetical protein